MKSIAVPASRFIFKYQRISTVSVRGIGPSGQETTTDVPLIDEAALIVTKSYSFRSPKRTRDLLDIYLAVKQCRDQSEVTAFLRKLKESEPETFNTLYAVEQTITQNPGMLTIASEYLPPSDREPAEQMQSSLIEFLREAGVEPLDAKGYEETVVLE